MTPEARKSIVDEMFGLLGTGRSTQTVTSRYPDFDVAEGYQLAAALRARREARGERVVGRKAGFTNYTIWSRYNMSGPIWGFVYDTTLHDLTASTPPFVIAGLSEPRIEPEIVFGFRSAPAPEMTPRELLDTIGWVAHGFEIVQSVYPGWKFQPADTIAAHGLHGALFVGEKRPITDPDGLMAALGTFEIELLRDGAVEERGGGRNVLDSPLLVIQHLVKTLAEQPEHPPLAAGEVVTTGTLTDAMPIRAGETWSTRLSGIDLPPARITFA